MAMASPALALALTLDWRSGRICAVPGSLKRGTRIERVPALERGEVPALLRAPRRQRQKDRPRAPAEMLSELG
jgi:hypothetical protein